MVCTGRIWQSAMLTVREAHAGWRTVDIDCQDSLPVSLAFTGDSKRIVSGERCSQSYYPGVRLRQYQVDENLDKNTKPPVDSGTIAIKDSIDCAVVSMDGQWIVSITGTKVMVSNTTTKEVVEVDEHTSGVPVHAIDLSPDSTRFASGSEDKTVRVFTINTRKTVMYLRHNNKVLGVKFSPNGERLAAVASGDHVRVWDARNGQQLFRTPSAYAPIVNPNTSTQSPTCIPLGWSSDSDRVFTVTSGKIMGFVKPGADICYYEDQNKPSTMFFQESVPATDDSTHFTLTTGNGKVIACAAGRSLSFWDTSSYSKIGPTINFQDSILSIALSSDDSYLACGRDNKKITVYALRDFLTLHDILDVNHIHPCQPVPT